MIGVGFPHIGMRREPTTAGRGVCVLVGGLMAVVVGWWSGGQTLVAWAGPVLARMSRAVMTSGVVSVMVAWMVAWRMGAFHTIWMSKAASSSA